MALADDDPYVEELLATPGAPPRRCPRASCGPSSRSARSARRRGRAGRPGAVRCATCRSSAPPASSPPTRIAQQVRFDVGAGYTGPSSSCSCRCCSSPARAVPLLVAAGPAGGRLPSYVRGGSTRARRLHAARRLARLGPAPSSRCSRRRPRPRALACPGLALAAQVVFDAGSGVLRDWSRSASRRLQLRLLHGLRRRRGPGAGRLARRRRRRAPPSPSRSCCR